jgi:hypothetical protein
VFELGNEQYNPHFVEQVAAMEARSKQVGSPPLHYMFPENGGVNAADAAAILAAMPDVVPRILPDLHVGAGGAVGEARGLFANPPVHGFVVARPAPPHARTPRPSPPPPPPSTLQKVQSVRDKRGNECGNARSQAWAGRGCGLDRLVERRNLRGHAPIRAHGVVLLGHIEQL